MDKREVFSPLHAEREIEFLKKPPSVTIWSPQNGVSFRLLIPRTVYPPREDTDLLARRIISFGPGRGRKFLEIGCGSGAVSILAASMGWKVSSCDINPFAVAATRGNMIENQMDAEIKEGGVGDRICVDLIDLLNEGEGMLVGSSSNSLVLVHGETVESEYVPPRPFRVNAGPPHAYVNMADGTTKYLSELKTGDDIQLTNAEGVQRSATIGRLKIEIRPMILIRWIDENNKEGSMFLQQAETVRVIGEDKRPKSITALKKGDSILGWCQKGARHIGAEISSNVSER